MSEPQSAAARREELEQTAWNILSAASHRRYGLSELAHHPDDDLQRYMAGREAALERDIAAASADNPDLAALLQPYVETAHEIDEQILDDYQHRRR